VQKTFERKASLVQLKTGIWVWLWLRFGYMDLGMTMAYGQWVGEHLAAWEELLLFPKSRSACPNVRWA